MVTYPIGTISEQLACRRNTMKALTIDDCQKFVQICFWIVSGTIVVLTYLRARKSVLSTVNTEYQKRVMDRLQKLSEQLYEEFDVDNLQQWVMNRPLLEGIKQMNEEFEENKEHFLEKKEWDEGFPYTSDLHSLNKILNPLKTDPFVPTEIRKLLVNLLEKRIGALTHIYMDDFKRYGDALARGECKAAGDIASAAGIQNYVLDQLSERGCNYGQLEREVGAIRTEIQKYFESFDPR